MRDIDILTLEQPEVDTTEIKHDDYIIGVKNSPSIEASVFASPKVKPAIKSYNEEKVEPKTQKYRTYNSDIFDRYEVVQTAIKKEKPSFSSETLEQINESFAPNIETVTYTQKATKQKATLKVTNRGRITGIVYVAVALFMGFAMIYNTFVLSSLSTQISTISNTIESFQVGELTRISSEVQNIKEEVESIETARDNGYVPIDESNTQEITLIERQQVVSYAQKTSFFDKLVNAISRFFGG